MVQPADEVLRSTLEQLALREIVAEHGRLSWDRFRDKLRRPQFRLTDQQHLGRWLGHERCIEISRGLLFDHPWGALVEVLVHEMAHQYVDEVLGAREEPDHGQTFQRVCREFHVDPRAAGVPATPTDGVREAILDKISKLLALATSPNPHEAQSAMNAARRLMLKHNLERTENDRSHGYVTRQLGRPVRRVEAHRCLATAILGDYFFVECIWVGIWNVREARRETVLEVCGTQANVDLAEYVNSFLVHTAEALWSVQRGAGAPSGVAARNSFLRGVMEGFREKLEHEGGRDREAGLVWVGDPALAEYFRGRNPHVQRRSGRVSSDADANARGREEGRKMVLHKAVEGSADPGDRQLGPGQRAPR
ncbi:MAG: DUF2786 domain-containing protein [Deltaproteobacteria bacterium]